MSNEKETEYLPEECLAEIDDVIDHLNKAMKILERLDDYKISHFSFYHSRVDIKGLISRVESGFQAFVTMGVEKVARERKEKEEKANLHNAVITDSKLKLGC